MMKVKLYLSVVLALCFFAGITQAATLALWEFNDKVPGQAAVQGERLVDSSGNGRDAFISSTSVPEFWISNPEYGMGAAIHTTTGNAKILFATGHNFGDAGPLAGTQIADFNSVNSFTLEAVVRYPVTNDSANKVCAIMQKAGASTATTWWWRVQAAGEMKFFLSHNGSTKISVTADATKGVNLYDGQWHHVAVVRNVATDTLKLYVDYVEKASGADNVNTTTLSYTDTNLYIGHFSTNDTTDLIGSMDMARVSNAALKPSEFLKKIVFPANRSPADEAFNVATSSTALSWSSIADQDPNATLTSQTIIVATDPGMTNVVQSISVVDVNSVVLPTTLNYAAQYYWAVDSQGTDDGGAFTREGNVWSFQTEEAAGNIAAWWRFDDGTPGATLVEGDMMTDLSGNARHLYLVTAESYTEPSLYGNPSPAYGATGASYEGHKQTAMKLYPGYDFGGGNVASSPIIIPVGGDLTIEAVVRFDTAENGTNVIIAHVADSSSPSVYWYNDQREYWFRIESAGAPKFYANDYNGSTTSLSTTSDIYDGQWHHIAMVRDTTAGLVRMYVDYTEVNTATDNMGDDIVSTARMAVGAFDLSGGEFTGESSRVFNGDLDFVKVTRAALTSAQFEQAMAMPLNPVPSDGEAGITLATSQVSWTRIAGATITSQKIEISTDPYMQTGVTTIAASGDTAPISGLVESKTYYWRVLSSGSDTGGSFTDRPGHIWSFSTPGCALDATDGDLVPDCIIDLKDFAVMASNWLLTVYEE